MMRVMRPMSIRFAMLLILVMTGRASVQETPAAVPLVP